MVVQIIGGVILGFIGVYLFFRLASSAVFRSYYEIKNKFFKYKK